MTPLTDYPCPHCNVAKKLRCVRAFAMAICAECGTEWRPRAEIGGWRLLEPLARSGLAVIYRAVAPEGRAEVAVKLVRPPFGSTAEDFARFAAEVKILAGFDHPNWVRVFGGGIEEDLAWLAMEWLPESSLAARGRIGEGEALQFAAQASSALASAAAAGLRHRDLEITNCLLADAQTLKVDGFAESVFYTRAGDEAGTICGRLCCAPPERLSGDAEDVRTEIYALGAALFQMLSGVLPYEGEVLPELFLDRLESAPLRLEDAVQPVRKSTAQLVERMLAVEPSERFQTWDEVLENLAGLLATPAIPVRTRAVTAPVKAPVYSAARGAWFSIAMLAGIAGIAGLFGWRHFHEPVAESAAPATVPADSPPADVRAAPLAMAAPVPEAAAIPAPAVAPPKPVPVAMKKPRPPATPPPPAPPPAPAKMDWAVWKKVILESPNRPKIGRGNATRIADSEGLRLTGNNSGMLGGHDECIFFTRQLDGDWTLTARVGEHDGPAGIVAREGIGSERPCVGIFLGVDGKLNSVLRKEPAARLAPLPVEAPAGSVWLKIVRSGAAMSAFHSNDGKHWREAATLNLPALPTSVPAGFVVWSGALEKLAGATFEDVALKAGK